MRLQNKKRFMRNKLGLSTKNLSRKDVDSFFDKIDAIKRKYKK